MKKRNIVFLLLLVLLAVAAAGCGGQQAQPKPGETVEQDEWIPVTITDDTGNAVEISARPERFVSLIPSLTEILYALGLGEKVVGVTNFCNYPEEALAVEKVGDAFNPNAEKIISLDPSVVLSPTSSALEEVYKILNENGITVAVFDPKTLDEIGETITRVSQLAGVEEEGNALMAGIEADRKALNDKVAQKEPNDRPQVFVLLDSDYIFTVGDGEYLSEMIEVAGGVNAASGQGEGYLMLSEEVLFQLDPEVIICTFPMSEQVLAKESWQELSAVKSGRVYDVDGDLVTRPGPRYVQGLEELYRVFYP